MHPTPEGIGCIRTDLACVGDLVHRTSHDATLRATYEVEDKVEKFAGLLLLFDSLDSLRGVEPTLVDGAVDLVDEEDVFVAEATSAQPNDIDTAVD